VANISNLPVDGHPHSKKTAGAFWTTKNRQTSQISKSAVNR
jgi:hypothetical protein